MKVFTVVVTFNRLSLLKSVIDSIKGQTYIVDEIIVVNNDSTDGTDEWLSTQKGIKVIHQANLGGAGGFNRGMQYAYENGADWIWTMDDDVFPEPNALEELIRYNGFSSCLIPTRVYSDEILCNWGGIYDLKRRRLILGTRPRDQKEARAISFVNTCCFEGMLISRNIVRQIGYPDTRFFISGDDTIYGLLASQYTNILLVNSAIVKRAKSSREDLSPSPFYLYYYFRNFHLFEEYFVKMYEAKGFSVATKVKHLYEGYIVMRRAYRAKGFSMQLFKSILRGILDAYKHKCGKSF